ncbi:MAG: GTPase [Alphaproteobacteria bacterium]|nr:GTPase [Alphaproteobacteria bacterium]
MRLKSFYAKTMTEAMQMVRESLGEDAIIVATREENGGKAVRVTAAIDDRFHNPSKVDAVEREHKAGHDLAFELNHRPEMTRDRDDWLQYDDEQEAESSLAESIIDVLLKHGAPEDILDQIVNCAAMSNLDEPSIAFMAALDTLYNFTPLPTQAYKKAMMFVGAPGAGKTLTVAKLAAQGVMNGLNIAVITTDTVRAGGVEQLKSFTKLLKIDLKTAKGPAELTKALADVKGADQILIDTPGFNPFKTADMRALASLGASGDIEPILTLAAAGDADESGEIARIFSALGVRRFVATRLDIARRLGGLLSAAQHGGLAFSEASGTASVADGLMPLTARSLTGYFFPKSETSSTDSLRKNLHQTSRKKSTG